MNTTRAQVSIGADSKELDRDLKAARKKLQTFGKDITEDVSHADIYKAMRGQWKRMRIDAKTAAMDVNKALSTIGLPDPKAAAASGKKGGRAGSILGRVWGAGAGAAGKVAGAVGAGLGINVAGGILDMAGDLLSFEKTLTRFQITAGKSAGEMMLFRQSVLDVSKATGVGQDQVLAGAQTYVDLTGDVKGAEAAMNSFARIAQASGSSVSDIATATAALQQSMGLKPGDIEKVFSGLITQGKVGAVSLKDFAGELSSLAPRFAKFGGGTGNSAILDLGAALQAARQGFGSSSEAATGLEALMGSLSQNARKFQASGVKIFNTGKDGKKTFRGFYQIIDDISKSKLANNPDLLTRAFGSKEAMQAYDMLVRNKDLLGQLTQAGQDAGAVQRDLNTYQESAAGKIEKSWNNVKIALAEAFTPERIEKFAAALSFVIDKVAKVIGLIQDMGNVVGTIEEDLINKPRQEALVASGGASRADQMQRANELAKMSEAELAQLEVGGQSGFTKKQRDAAVQQLYGGAMSPHGWWDAFGAAPLDKQVQVSPQAQMAAAMKQALEGAKLNVTVNLDGSVVGQKVDNAPNARSTGKR